MTPEAQAAIAALKAVVSLLEKPEFQERVVPLDEGLWRLGISHEAWRKNDELRRELPLIEFSRESKGFREETLNEFIRKREKLARGRLKDASKKSA